jgi:hypothetical protein
MIAEQAESQCPQSDLRHTVNSIDITLVADTTHRIRVPSNESASHIFAGIGSPYPRFSQ